MEHRIRSIRSGTGLILAAGLAALSGSVTAQTVYKCSGPGQPVAYQQTPCASGLRSEQLRLAAVASVPPEPASASATARPAARAPREPRGRPRTVATPVSYECRSVGGAVFYRHARCPASITRRSTGSPRAAEGVDRVQATPLPRAEACRRQRHGAREGAEHDETVSTYERNLGRDPCRRY